MWEFLMGFFFARATGLDRFVRFLLVLFAIGILIAGVIYTGVFLRAAIERSSAPHVYAHHTH